MKNFFLLTLFFSYTLFSFGQNATPHIPNQVIIGFSDDATQAERQSLISQMGTLLSGILTTPTGPSIEQEVLILVSNYPVEVDNHIYTSEADLISTIQGQHAKVDNADFNYALSTEQYSFNAFVGNSNLNQYSPISASCEANYPGGVLEGGEYSPTTTTLKIGILDTGLDPYYPTINQYIAGEVNVLTDDEDPMAGITISYGYNPTTPVAQDDNGHGTAVAGIVAGLADRAGVSPLNLEIYIIKCFDSQGNGSMYNLLQAVRMTELLDLDIINLSWGYFPAPEDEYATALEDALRHLGNEENVIIVTGSGNDGLDLNTATYAPASIGGVANLITVGGVVGEERSCSGGLANFSNYGNDVEIAAPSASISAPGLNGYWALNTSGTSFAAPIVTSAVIQSWLAHDGNFQEPYQYGEIHPVCEIVRNTATYVPALTGSGIEGVVNFAGACNTAGVLYFQENDNATNGRTAGLHKTRGGGAAQGVEVAPNPFRDQLTITLPGANEAAGRVEVLSMQGAVVFEQKNRAQGTSSSRLALPTQLPAGPYLLRATVDGQIFTKMIVKN